MIISENLFESSTNSSLEILKQHFPNCFDKNGHFLPEKMTEQIQSQGINSREYYTMNWLGKSYARYLRDCPPATLLAENVAHNSLPENQHSQNLLIKGDNLEVLKHLKHAYAGEVKMIYIDPPYNTGSDGFVYQDDRKFTPEQLADLTEMSLEEAKRVLDFTAKKSNSHSAWLTFMYPRLYIARELLKDDGVIFISIDDNEQAQLKLLCDEVFGEENFVAEIVRNTNSSKNQSLFVSVSHEYCLIYAKNITTLTIKHSDNKWGVEKNNLKEYVKMVNTLRQKGLSNEEITEELKELTKYPRFIDFTNYWYFDGKGLYSKSDLGGVKNGNMTPLKNPLTNQFDPIPPGGFRYSSEKLQELVKNNRIHFHIDGSLPRIKRYLHENKKQRPKSIMSDDQRPDYALLQDMGIPFDNPKQIAFIKRIVSIFENDSLVLDFFAGSGTTAHAVMQLNAEDGGNRRFMMVQLPEKTDKKSTAFQAGYKTIFEITKARIEKAAAKIRQDFPDFQGDLGFKIFKTAENFLAVSDEEFHPIQPSLPETVDRVLSDEEYRTLLTTWRLYDGNALTESVQAVDLGGYFANRCGDNLYLLTPYFGSEQIKALLNKLDGDPDFLPKRIILFGANIDSAKQMELHQAVKTYANKKNIELNIVVRY